MKIKFLTTMLVALAMASTAYGQSGSSLALSLGGGSKFSFASAGYQLGLGVGKRNVLMLGLGARATYARSRDRVFDPIKPDRPEREYKLSATSTQHLNAALFVWAVIKPVEYLQFGASVDGLGYTFGRDNSARSTNGDGIEVQANPTGASVQLLSENSYGLLHSEYFVGIRVVPSVWVRGGIAHDHLELRSSPTLQGQERFGKSLNSFFIGVTLPLGVVEENN
jgi:hypothetical protein